jgi:indole-3-glycerol phosphate synthase
MILDQIVADKRLEVVKRKARIPSAEFRTRAENAPEPRDFAGALRGDKVTLVAEIKRASPSRGEIRAGVNPVEIARIYAENGAAAISVLTDRKYFHGEPNNLKAARAGCEAPLLRKDFIIDEYQVYESRALQADAILLIVRLLDDAQLRDHRALAEAFGMSVLVEVHDERELERALASGARIIGVNNRNLADFGVDLAMTERLAPLVPTGCIVVSESGIFSQVEVERVAAAGADAVLVGEALMRADDIGAKARELSHVASHKVQSARPKVQG